jgi:hypothetical protein
VSAPKQTCQLCGNYVEVTPFMRGFPPDAARAQLKRYCFNRGCPCDPKYSAGFEVRSRAALQDIQ